MSKKTTMTFRIDANLKKQFMDAADKMNMPAAQVLRSLIHDFIQRNQEKSGDQKSGTLITLEEQEKRRKAARFAIASVGLEGFKVPESEIQHMERFISGEISFQEFMEAPFL